MLESVKSRDELYQMSRHGQEIMDQIEQSSKPIVAAIAGSCLGGGFEVSLILIFVIEVFAISLL
jgi:enoyl-CoA hydratase/carnithine racemase